MESIAAYKRELVHRAGKSFLQWAGDFQGRHSRISTAPILQNDEFPWIPQLETCWRAIRAELDDLLEYPERIPAFHRISPDQERISKGDHWKTFVLYIFGNSIGENCGLCPQTAKVLEGLPGLQNAWFSILAPHYRIPPHKGPTRALVRCHLALKVPQEREKCWLRVDDRVCHWTEGECLVFDDTYDHEVHNDTDEVRVVLFLDFDRPMDRIGGWFNGFVLRLMQASHYVKDPLKNLNAWNRRLARNREH